MISSAGSSHDHSTVDNPLHSPGDGVKGAWLCRFGSVTLSVTHGVQEISLCLGLRLGVVSVEALCFIDLPTIVLPRCTAGSGGHKTAERAGKCAVLVERSGQETLSARPKYQQG